MSVQVGKRLKRARELMGLSIEDIEVRTRIDKKYLYALENGDLDALGDPIYARSFLRSYANAVGEDYISLSRLCCFNTPLVTPLTQAGSFRRVPPDDRVTRVRRKDEMVQYPSRRDHLSQTGSYPAVNQWTNRLDMIQAGQDSITARSEQTATSMLPTTRVVSRRVSMPSDLPAPEELGIKTSQKTGENVKPLSTLGFPSRSQAYGSRSVKKNGKSGSGRKNADTGKVYTWLLIIGAVLLVVAAIFVYWYHRSNQQQASIGKPVSLFAEGARVQGGKSIPTLLVVETSAHHADRYQLMNTNRIDLKIKNAGSKSSQITIRSSEVGTPINRSNVEPGKTFSASFNHKIWLTLDEPEHLNVTINDSELATKKYRKKKDYEISLLP